MNDIALALMKELPANGMVALLLIPLIQWAKKQGHPWLAWVTSTTAPWISAVTALAASVGIHFAYDPSARDFIIHLPTLAAFLQGILEWAKQYAVNHWSHRGYKVLETIGKFLDEPDILHELDK